MNAVEEKINCLHCGKPQTELTRFANTEEGKRVKTKTTIKVCTNRQCWSYINIREVKNWETK